jgi:hypothetical protein
MVGLSKLNQRVWRLAMSLVLGLSSVLALQAAPVSAAGGEICTGFAVTVGARTYRNKMDIIIPASQVTGTIRVRGVYVTFDVNPTNFTVLNYTLTGHDSPRPDKNLPIDAPLVVYVRKAPQHGDTLNSGLSLKINGDSLVLQRHGVRQTMKIQAKDCAQGGLFQMEAEPGTTENNVLGPDFHYTVVPAGQTRLCFTNGKFTGYDSPEAATLVSHTTSKALWSVRSGGRIGMVIGEDAVEGGCRLP